jgi:hypothetical protein
MENEVWKDIRGFEGLYMVSNLGRVRSLTFKGRRRDHILKPGITQFGYHNVILMRDGVRNNAIVHRVVAQAFIDNPQNLPWVDHIDGVRCHNNASNLRWCSASQNQQNRGRTSVWRGRTTSTTYKGVSYRKRGNCVQWTAAITYNKKQHHIGSYRTAEDAARAYDAVALEKFGRFARLNFPSNDEQSYPV